MVTVVPTAPELGEMEEMVGVCAGGTYRLMVNVLVLEVPPPGVGLYTVTLAVPDVAVSDAEMEAVSWVADT